MDRRATRLNVAEGTPAADRRQVIERRDGLRGRTLLSGRLFYGPELRLSLDVQVRNLSATGARAIMPPGEACPSSGVLLIPKTAKAYPMRTAWSEGGQSGLHFEAVWDMESAGLPPEAKAVRRLWVELTLR